MTAGTVPYFVRLATTRRSGGEDEATVAPGTTVVLRSDDVDWGETIDGRLEFTARDQSGDTFVDELDDFSFVRPTEEDCAAVHAPTQVHPSPPAAPGPSAEEDSSGARDDSAAPAGRPTTGQPPTASASSELEPRAAAVPTGSGEAGTAVSASADQVVAGQTVTVRGTGFLPGEQVSVRLLGDALLGTATAGPDGSVRAEVRIPEASGAGRSTVTLVGSDSAAAADVDLRIAAASTPAGDDGPATVPLLAAVGALLATGVVLLSGAGRSRARARGRSLSEGA